MDRVGLWRCSLHASRRLVAIIGVLGMIPSVVACSAGAANRSDDASATAAIEQLSHDPVAARAYLDPGPTIPAHSRLEALVRRGSDSLQILAHSTPALSGYPSYTSVGDLIRAAGSSPDDPVSRRIAGGAILFLSDGVPSDADQLRPQIVNMLDGYLKLGWLDFDSGDFVDASLATLITSGWFDTEQLDQFCNTLVSGVAVLLREPPPPNAVELEMGAVSTAQSVGSFLYVAYHAEQNQLAKSQGSAAAAKEIQTKREQAAQQLSNAVNSNPATALYTSVFLNHLWQAMLGPDSTR